MGDSEPAAPSSRENPSGGVAARKKNYLATPRRAAPRHASFALVFCWATQQKRRMLWLDAGASPLYDPVS